MNPLPYFVLDSRKRTDKRYRIYIRQNVKPAIVIPTDFFVKSRADFKRRLPKDPVLKNFCIELIQKLENAEKKLGGAATLRDCWTQMTEKPKKSEFVVDSVMLGYRFQIKEFNPKWKVGQLTTENLIAYLQHLKKSTEEKKALKDSTISGHFAELRRAARHAKRYFDVPNDVFDFKPRLKRSLPREPLNWIELMKLFNLPVDPVLDMFLLECFTGIRYSDLNDRMRIMDSHILIVQKKTGAIAAPALNEFAKKIIKRNSVMTIDGELKFVPLDRPIQSVNRRLKSIADKHGITKNLSTHIGRHSYAKLLRDLAVPEDFRAIQLGHGPVNNTQLYGRTSDYDSVARFVLMAFKRASESKAKKYDEWLIDINPMYKEVYSNSKVG